MAPSDAAEEEAVGGHGEEDARRGEQRRVQRAEGGEHHRGGDEHDARRADQALRHVGGDEA